jgi:hypothetical protein
MGYFNATVEAYLNRRSIAGSLLVFMDFVDTPRRWWPGFGDLVAGGHTWQGTGEMISVSGLEQPIGTSAPQTTFTLSGVDASIITLARNAAARVKGRRVVVYLQCFEIDPANASIAAWTPLDAPAALWTGTMDQMKYSAQGPGERSVTVTAESRWTNRNRPPFGLFTNADQVARFAGDRGLEQVPDLENKTIRWPGT